jgi:hypothetical protein
MNDVHNGIYDVMPLDDDLVLGVKKREYNQQEALMIIILTPPLRTHLTSCDQIQIT